VCKSLKAAPKESGSATGVARKGTIMDIQDLKQEREYVELGNLLHSQGEYQKAIAAYNNALRIDPADADALFNKGETLALIGNHAEAQKLFDTAIAMYAGKI
jgi:tetratricopeptide (TPR) repeat protein